MAHECMMDVRELGPSGPFNLCVRYSACVLMHDSLLAWPARLVVNAAVWAHLLMEAEQRIASCIASAHSQAMAHEVEPV